MIWLFAGWSILVYVFGIVCGWALKGKMNIVSAVKDMFTKVK